MSIVNKPQQAVVMPFFLMGILNFFVFFLPVAFAQNSLALYYKQESVSGNLTMVGSDTLVNLITGWADLFKHLYPSVNIQIQTLGSSSAVPALLESTAQIGTMSRKMSTSEFSAFERRYGYLPTEIIVAIDAMAIFVHQDNPIHSVSLVQIDQLFSATRRCSALPSIKYWGELGLTGNWASRMIQLYGRNSVSGTYGFFKQKAMCDGDFRTNVNEQPSSSSVVQSVSSTVNAIGYAGVGNQSAETKLVPIRTEAELVFPNVDNIVSGKYPLSRYLYIYVNKPPNKALPLLENEFIRLILSRQGQALVIKDGFIPLPPNEIKKQLQLLNFDTVYQYKKTDLSVFL